MSTPWWDATWIGVAVSLTIALGAIAYFLWKWRQGIVHWKALPTELLGDVKYVGNVEPDKLLFQLGRAIGLLSVNTPFTAEFIATSCRGLHIVVMQEKTWVDVYGRKVAGDASGTQIRVGSDLAALCHELSHLCCKRAFSDADDFHARWAERGLQKAQDAYEADLVNS